MDSDNQETIYRSPTPEWTLKIIDGFDTGKVFILRDSQEYTIGRKNCDIILNQQDMKASRLHARLEIKKAQPFLENLSQTTATYVNNSPIKKIIKLKAGNKIGIGDTVFVIERTGASKRENKINVKLIGVGACVFILMLVILKIIWNPQPSPVKLPDEPTPSEQPTVMPTIINTPSVSPPPTLAPTKKPVPPINKEKADELFRQGRIFYKNGNLKKAIGFFETASQYPDHPYASEYLERARNELEKKINQLVTQAEQAKKLVKNDRAKHLLREIIELLSDKPQDKRYVEAQNKLRELENR